MEMITFDRGDTRFNYRVAAVCVREGHALLLKALDDDFWYLPGGRCELQESSRETLRRELDEELAVSAEIGRLLWFVENFYVYAGRRIHELALYYDVRLPDEFAQFEPERDYPLSEDGVLHAVRWVALERIDRIRLLPSFLRSGLRRLPEQTQHLVHVDVNEREEP